MATPLDPKEIATFQELTISNMLELEALIQLLFEKEIITQDEFTDKFRKLDREMNERSGW